jgi:hypothetical protein
MVAMYNKPVVLSLITLFDNIEKHWKSRSFMRLLGTLLVLFFLLSLVMIEMQRLGWLGSFFSFIPVNHFKSIEFAFTLLLFFEVVELVLSLEKSVSQSMHIQLEILSLILLRSAFKMVGDFPEVITIDAIKDDVIYIFTDAFGALLIFFGVLLIKRFEKSLSICRTEDGLNSFVAVKKLLALILLMLFVVLITMDVYFFFQDEHTFDFFHAFYTILIFSDVLVVFISLRYSDSYLVLFRNSGFALGTVIIRLALNTNPPYNALLGVLATVFILGLVYLYNKAYADEVKGLDLPRKFTSK